MLKYYEKLLHNIMLLHLTCLAFFTILVQASNLDKDIDQFENQSTSTTSDENNETPSGFRRTKRPARADTPKYLSLTLTHSQIDLIIQRENELKNNYNGYAELPMLPGHHWNVLALSNNEAKNVCYSVWLGLKFNEIDGLDKTDLPHQLYAYCNKAIKCPIGNLRSFGKNDFCYNIVYPYTEKHFKCKPHRIGVLQCVCKFTRAPRKRIISNDSNRSFFIHKFKDSEYLVLSPASKERNMFRDLRIIDIQKVHPSMVHLGDKMYTPIYPYQTLGQSISASNEHDAMASGSSRTETSTWSNFPKHLSLSVSASKIDIIIEKENKLMNNYNYSNAFPKKPGHHWDLSELSEDQATNVCYSLWLGLKFSEIDELDKTDLPPQLYAHCKSKKIPIGDSNDSGMSPFCYSIVYPYTDSTSKIKPQSIGVLQCVCRFTRVPNRKYVSNESNKKFFSHKLQDNEYLILSPASKAQYQHKNLKIIDVQEVDPTTIYLGGKSTIPIFTN